MPEGQFDATLLVNAKIDTSQLYQQIANVSSRLPALKLKTQGFQALGTISKEANEFNRSLAASNSRVLAFSASASVLFGLIRGFNELTKSTIEVQKSLAELNITFNVSEQQLSKLGDSLFQTANKTGQSWRTASAALLEFSRQGLTIEESLKRTNDALSLTRFTGLGVQDSILAITTVLNSFDTSLITSTKLLEKLAAVDISEAVSGRELLQGVTRVGSIAKDAGVQFDKLLGLITAARVTSGRTGEVVGTALGTILQRLGRTESLDTLEQLGVAVRDLNGEYLSGDRILQNLSKTYSNLSSTQQTSISMLVGGIRQGNILRALMSDLSKENSIFARATLESANASGFAAQRNEELNKTLSAQINEFVNNLTKSAAAVGNFTIKPALETILNGSFGLNTLLKGFQSDDSETSNIGQNIGTGILRGLGDYLSGPGLLVVTALGGKLFGNFASFAIKSFTSILEATSKEYAARQAISNLLASQPGLMDRINRGALSQVEIQQAILASLRAQSLELARQGQIVGATQGLIKTGAIKVSGSSLALGQQGIGLKFGQVRARAVGHIPEIQEKLGAYAGGYTPGQVKSTNIPKLGQVYYNTAETIKKFPGLEQPAILPPLNSKAGLNYKKDFTATHGFNPYKSEGLVPNYAYIPGLTPVVGKLLTNTVNPSGYDINSKILSIFQPGGTRRILGALKDKPQISLPNPKNINEFDYEAGRLFPFRQMFGLKTPKEFSDIYIKNKDGTYSFNPNTNAGMSYLNDIRKNEMINFGDFRVSTKKGVASYHPVMARYHKEIDDNKDIIKYKDRFDFSANSSDEKINFKQLFGQLKEGYRVYNRERKAGFGRGFSLKEALFQSEGIFGVPQYSNVARKLIGAVTKPITIQGQTSLYSPNDRGLIHSGLIPSFANPNDKFLSFLSQINPSYITKFRGIQKQDTGLAKFIRNNSDLKGADNQQQMGELLKKSLLQYTPSQHGIKSTSYFNLDKSPDEIRGQITELFGRFNKSGPFSKGLIPSFAGYDGYSMSNNARLAYLQGELPASQAAKQFGFKSAKSIRESFSPSSWHHTSKMYNSTDFFNIDEALNDKSLTELFELKPKLTKKGLKLIKDYARQKMANNLIPEKEFNFGQNRKTKDTRISELLSKFGNFGRDSGAKFSKGYLTSILANKELSESNFLQALSKRNYELSGNFQNPSFAGLVPNFNALSSAISRENKAGIPFSKIKVGQSPILKAAQNPLGLGVYNTQDEPLGLNQGINRVASLGLDPKKAGTYSKGGIPNFALNPENFQYTPFIPAQKRQEFASAYQTQYDLVKKGLKSSEEALNSLKLFADSAKPLPATMGKISNSLKLLERNVKPKGFFSNLSGQTGVISGKQLGFDFSGPDTEKVLDKTIGNIRRKYVPLLASASKENLSKIIAEEEKEIKEARQKLTKVSIGTGKQGEFIGITQQTEIERRNRLLKQENSQFLRNNLLNYNPNSPSLRKPDLSILNSANLYNRIPKKSIDELTSDRLQKLESKANSFFAPFTTSGRQSIRDLQKASPDSYRQVQQTLQNRAFLASIVVPVVGGVLQQTIGRETKLQRGSGEIVGGATNAASFALTGFALGGKFGPQAAVAGGALGLLLSLPKIINAFTDTLPDLQRRLEELKDTSQTTAAALDEYIGSAEKLSDVFSGKITGVTNREIEQLKQGQVNSLLSITNLQDRQRIQSLVESGNLTEARSQSGIINQRNKQAENSNLLAQSVKTLLPNIKSESQIRLTGSQKFDVGKFRDLGELRFVSKEEKNIFRDAEQEFVKKQINDPKRLKQIENLSSGVEQTALGLTNSKGKTIFDELLNNTELSKQLSQAKPGELGKTFADLALSLDGFDTESIAKISEALTNLDESQVKEFGARLRETFGPEGIKKLKNSSDVFVASQEKTRASIYALNKALLESQRNFEKLGTSIEISGIERLTKVIADLKIGDIKQNTSNQISLLTRGGEGTRNLFDLRSNLSGIRNQATENKERLQTQTGEQVFENITDLRNGLTKTIKDGLEKTFGESSPDTIQKRLNESIAPLNTAFQPFIDTIQKGGEITPVFLENLSKTIESQVGLAEQSRKAAAALQGFVGPLTQDQQAQFAFSKNFNEVVDQLNSFGNNVLKISRTFDTANAQIENDLKNNNRVALQQFNSNSELVDKRFATNQDINRRLSEIDVGSIIKQANLSRERLGARPEKLIELQNQSNLIGTKDSLLKQSVQNNPEIGTLGLNAGNLENKLPELIETAKNKKQELLDLQDLLNRGTTTGLDQNEFIKSEELQKKYKITSEDEVVKKLEEEKDLSKSLINLNNDILNKKKELNAQSKEEIEDLKNLLAFSKDRLDIEKRINQENSRIGKFSEVNKNLGNTLSESFSFNSNDFFDQLSSDVASFGADFKDAFKQGFSEARKGTESLGDTLRNVLLNISNNILDKAGNLAIDTLFGAVFGNQKVGGGSGLLGNFFSGNKKNLGGPIKKYAYGGFVDMGSGVRDDVPALLSGGEFVINKKSTQKIGKRNLDILNNINSIPKLASGGDLPFPKQIDKFDLSSNSANISLANEYYGFGSRTRPKKGEFNTSSLLSAFGQTDEDNPQNQLKFAREKYFIEYEKYRKQIRKAERQFEQSQRFSLISAYVSAGINLGGSLLSKSPTSTPTSSQNTSGFNTGYLKDSAIFGSNKSYTSPSRPLFNLGGMVKKYAYGGSVFGGDTLKDNIPAMLMGGEFVLNKAAVKSIGTDKMNYMNKTGKIPKFANGGYLGDSSFSNNYTGGNSNNIVNILSEIRDSLNNNRINNNNNFGNNKNNNNTNNLSPAPIIYVNTTVTMTSDGRVNSNTDISSKDNKSNNSNQELNQESLKKFSNTITSKVKEVIINESRSGGLLESKFKTK